MIAELIRNSSAGRKEFNERAVHRDDELHLKLAEAVKIIFKIKKRIVASDSL